MRYSVYPLVNVELMRCRQTSTWGDQITYPAPSDPNQGTGLTTNMTPVAHLAQNGYVPTAMAMVLCNDPNVESFCSMVQKLHQEGVVSLPALALVPSTDTDI